MKLKLLFALISIGSLHSYGQELNQSEWLWGINVENTSITGSQSLGFIDKNGHHFMVGNFNGASASVQGTTLQNSSIATAPIKSDAFIARFDENGTLMNVIHFEGSHSENITSIEYDGEDHYYISGAFQGTMKLNSSTVLENQDLSLSKTFIAKFNLSGQLIWSKVFDEYIGSTYLKYKNGYLYMAGNYAWDQLTFENTVLPEANYNPTIVGMDKNLVAKFTASNGNLVWVSSSKYTGPHTTVSSDRIGAQVKTMAIDNNGNVYIAGDFFAKSVTFGSITLNRSSNTNANVFFVSYNSSGAVAWAKTATIGATSDAKVFDMGVDSANDLYITGIAYNSTINFDGTSLQFPGNYGSFLVKYNTAGNLLWAKKGGISSDQAPGTGLGSSWFSKLYIDAEDSIYIGGNFYKYLNLGPGFVYNLEPQSYLILAKYNKLGTAQSAELYPYNPNSAANLKVLSAGTDFSIISNVYGNLQLNNLSLSANQITRLYIAKRKSQTASNEEFDAKAYSVYPNPVTDVLFIKGIENLSDQTQFEISDVSGKKIGGMQKKEAVQSGINVSDLSAGIYFLSIYDSTGKVKQYSKFIKSN